MALIIDKFFEYKPGCYIRLNSIESIRFHENLSDVEIGLQSGDGVRCSKKVYYKLQHLLSIIKLNEDDIKP